MSLLNGFYDLQVNGYAGVDFNDVDLTVEDVSEVCAKLGDDGVVGILPTVITANVDRMCQCLSIIAASRDSDPLVRELVTGVHIEGPFINETPGYVGAHPVDAVRPANGDMMRRLTDAAGGLTRIVTLAPERDPGFGVTRWLAEQGIVVAAGHCDPSLDQLRGAIDAGLTMFTHLGNGCPMTMHRHDNIIQRVLALSDRLWISLIADGVHVPYFVLNTYLQQIGWDRAVAVTDAISAAGLGPGQYTIAGHPVIVREDGFTHFPGDETHLAGSAATMPQMVERLRQELHLNDDQIRRLVCENPRRAIRG